MKKSLWLGLTLFSLFSPAATIKLKAQTTPSTISGLQLWLDAADPNADAVIPANASTITSWKDKSGNNRHATIVSSGAFTNPVYYRNQINGKGTVRFTGSTVIGAGFSAPLDIRAMTNPEITIFTVYKQGTRGTNQAVWGCDDGGWDRFFFSTWDLTPDNGSVCSGVVAPTLQTVNGSGIFDKVQCLTAVYSKASGTNGSAIYLNGSKVTTFTDATTMGADAIAAVRIGLDGNDNFFTGDIAEMIVYNRKLSECEITQVNRYLNVKYDVSFTPVAATAGGATTFKEGERVTLNTSTTGTSYQWLKNNVVIAGATTNTYVATETGNYRVAVTNSCIDTSTAIAVAATIPAAPDNALMLDGVNDYVEAGTAITAGAIKTLECWARFNSLTGEQEILSKSKSGYGIELLLYNNTLSFFCMNGANTSYISYPSSNLATGRWYHLAATWDGSTKESMKLYVDGSSVGTRSDLGALNSSGIADPGAGTRFYVGAWTDAGRYFNGAIDEVRIWSTNRTQAQLREFAYDTIPRNTADMLLYLRMDQGTAAGTNTGNTILKDYSANARTVNAINFTMNGAGSNYVESYAMVVPMLQNASSPVANSFLASWTAPTVGVVTNYRIDVATDQNFTNMLSGYANLLVNLGTTQIVVVPSLSATYYYRVRANKLSVSGQGAASWQFIPASVAILLPVKFESFDVTASPNALSTAIDWSTSAEINTSFFTIERSQDGSSFQAIGKVDAPRGSTGIKNYHFKDEQPLPGQNFYRVVSTDKDGKTTYTAIKSVYFEKTAGSVKVYPSPATTHLFVDLRAAAQQKGQGSIYTISGQHVRSVRVDSPVQKIDVSSLTPGIYMFRLGTDIPVKFEKK